MPWTTLKYLLRGMRRDAGTITLAIIALAMGIGFTTTLFSVVHGATRALPFEDPQSLVAVAVMFPGNDDPSPATPRELAGWQAGQRSFESLVGVRGGAVNLADERGRPERMNGVEIEPEAFAMLRTRPLIGRVPDAADAEPGARVVLLGETLWKNRYAGDPGILDRSIRIDGVPYRVIGVMAAAFRFPLNGELWIPRRFPMPAADSLESLIAFGRLRHGVSIEQASAEMRLITARVVAGGQTRDRRATTSRVIPFSETEFPPSMTIMLDLMLLASMGVLLVACVNVANLLVARFVARERDLAVRLALGASRRRLVVVHLAESFLVIIPAAIAGLGIAAVSVSMFANATQTVIEAFWMEFRVDLAALAFTGGLALLAGVAAGLLPAIGASRRDPADALRSGAGTLRIGRIGRVLVVGEVVFASVVLTVASLLVQSAVSMRARALPFDAHGILTMQLSVIRRPDVDLEATHRRLRDVVERVQAMPGVKGAAVVSALPGRGSGRNRFAIGGMPDAEQPPDAFAQFVVVTPGFPSSLDARVLRGRDFTWADDSRSPRVALVNALWVRRYMGGRNPLGLQVTVGRGDPFTIVGVVPDLMANDVEEAEEPAIYVPLLQTRSVLARLMVRAEGNPLDYVGAIRRSVDAVDSDLPLFETATLHEAIFADKKVLEAMGALFFAFGVAALLFTATGLYAIIAFSVTRRTTEFGVRLAVGARPSDIGQLVLREGGRRVLVGLLVGLLLAAGVAVALSSRIAALDPTKVAAYAVPFVTLALTALGALYVPARRAAKIQPLTALRG